MDIIVQKFGGTSVQNKEMLYKACEHIKREYNKGKEVVVVVSAQGKTTNGLIQQEQEITNSPSPREHDVLISTGEQITIAKLCMCLHEQGYKAISFTGWQIPIVTDNIYTDANIIKVNKEKIITELENKNIVVVAGFQGINEKGEITTLGRGGSDTTATYLAGILNAQVCEIYTDVNGVYEKDPNIYPDAFKYDTITYDEVLKITNGGAKVLHTKCVEVAKKFGVVIDVKLTLGDGSTGTLVN